MNYILVYSLSLLLYQTLYTVEQHRIRYYLAQLAKSNSIGFIHHIQHGANSAHAIRG